MSMTATDLHSMLTRRELDVLAVLCNSPVPLTASGIVSASDGLLKTNTVQAVLRTLLKEELVEVADIVYSGTVLCRSYQMTDKAVERVTQQLVYQFNQLGPDFTIIDVVELLRKQAIKDGREAEFIASVEQLVKETIAEREREKAEQAKNGTAPKEDTDD